MRKLCFVGEDYSGRDGPSAVVVRVSSGKSATVTFEDNFCERTAMNDSGNADRSTILIEPGHGTTNVTVLNCREINATARAGIEIKNGTDTNSTAVADVTISLRGNTVVVTDDDQALYGVAYIGSGEAWVPQANLNVAGNTIESRDCTGSGGIQTGLYVSQTPDGYGEITLLANDLNIIRNTIKNCKGDGIWLRSVRLASTASPNLTAFELERNNVRGCGGSALYLQRSDSTISAYAGYLNVQSKGNLFVQNYVGVKLTDTVGGSGALFILNDTIAYNSSFGLQFDGIGAAGGAVINTIVWENNDGGTQYGGTYSWTPDVQYCDFQGLSSGEGNLNTDPLFVSVASGDFHLDDNPASPCIDMGDSSPVFPTLTEIDIDGQPREQDGDDDATISVDMGADEVPDPSP